MSEIEITGEPRVLLVDDSEQNRYVLGRILRHGGLEVEECATGMEGLALAQHSPDLVIVDVKLPDISGYDVCRQLKSNPDTAHIPVLQISATFVNNESRVMALDGGADGYLTHPLDPTVLLATVRALLRLRQAENILRQSAQQWRSTFDALNEGLAVLDTEKRITRCNRAFSNVCRLPFKDIIGADGTELIRKCLGAPPDFLNGEMEVRYSGEWQHEGHWFHVSVDPVTTRGQRFGSIVVLNNIKERKMAEETLRNTEKLAATGRLAQTIAHEINNPLEALTNLIYLSQIHAEQPEVKNFLAQAQSELSRVSRITKQVLSFHRESTRPVPLELHEVLNNVINLYSRQIENKQISVKYDRSSPEPITIFTFPGELRQAIANLFGNALDATPMRGTITLRLRRRTVNGVPGASFTVMDTGPGIPTEIRHQIFEPFFTTKELRGSGLGLWLIKTIVSKHQGRLRFRTSTVPGHSGTCFNLFLPNSSSAVDSAHQDQRAESKRFSRVS